MSVKCCVGGVPPAWPPPRGLQPCGAGMATCSISGRELRSGEVGGAGLELGISDPNARAGGEGLGPWLAKGQRSAAAGGEGAEGRGLWQGPRPHSWSPGSRRSSPPPSLPSSHLGPEGALSLGRALDGCPHVREIR